jgi:hypothetical protein
MTLERVERSIATVIGRVDALEIGLPPADQTKLPDETREVDYEEEDKEDEPFNSPHPPLERQHHDDQQVHQELLHPPHQPNWQGMRGHPHCGPNQQLAHGNDDPFGKVMLTIPPFYGLYDAKDYLD